MLTRQGAVGEQSSSLFSGGADCPIDRRPVATFREGGFFGEMALLGTGRRRATVITEGAAELLVPGRRDFGHLLTAAPSAASTMTAMCSARRLADCLARTS